MTFQTKTSEFASSAQILAFPLTRTQPASAKMKRAPTLIRAARWRAARYRRARDLPRLAPGLVATKAGSAVVLERLTEIEADCQDALRSGAAHYDPARHVLALAALLAERRAAESASGQSARC